MRQRQGSRYLNPTHMIHARAISKRYGPVTAVHDLDLEVPEGTVCGLVGPNGAGKTSTIRMITGILPPDTGTLSVAGHPMPEERQEALSRLGYLPESAPLSPEMRVEEQLHFRGRLLGMDRTAVRRAVGEAMAACGIDHVRRRLVGTLSKGYRQRVGLASALVGDPALLVLDEPTVGLDPRQLIDFRGLLRHLADSCTIILSSHIMQEIEAVCDRVVVLHDGHKLADGTRDEIREDVGGSARIVGEAAGDPETIRTAVRRAAAGVDVEFKVLRDNVVRFEFPTNHDPRAVIGAVVADTGGVIRSLERRQPGLEEIFLELLRRAEPGEDEERQA